MAVDTGPSKLTVREVLFSLLEVARDPEQVALEAAPPPNEIADGDAAMLYRARRTFAWLILDNNRLRRELFEAKGSST